MKLVFINMQKMITLSNAPSYYCCFMCKFFSVRLAEICMKIYFKEMPPCMQTYIVIFKLIFRLLIFFIKTKEYTYISGL